MNVFSYTCILLVVYCFSLSSSQTSASYDPSTPVVGEIECDQTVSGTTTAAEPFVSWKFKAPNPYTIATVHTVNSGTDYDTVLNLFYRKDTSVSIDANNNAFLFTKKSAIGCFLFCEEPYYIRVGGHKPFWGSTDTGNYELTVNCENPLFCDQFTPKPSPQPTPSPIKNLPSECTGKCAAFTSMVEDYVVKPNIGQICMRYVIERLFDDKICTTPVEKLRLGLCDNDFDIFDERQLRDLIISFEIVGEPIDNSLISPVVGSDFQGYEMEVFVDDEPVEIKLCLNDQWNIRPSEITFSENAGFFRGPMRDYNCQRDWTQGLPCMKPLPTTTTW